MAKICYRAVNFKPETLLIIEEADGVASGFAEQGYEVTMRTVYYVFIAKDLLPDTWIDEEYNRKKGLDRRTKNTIKNYKRLCSIIDDGRKAGLIDWNHIIDTTRQVKQNSHWDSPAEIIQSCASQFRYDLWDDQDVYVEVWIEKDALLPIIGGTCTRYDVPYCSCRGYSSSSAMWAAAQRMVASGRSSVVVIHCGDHDPSGMDMTRDIEARLRLFASTDADIAIDVQRVALTMEQIRRYKAPPNPAKATDVRSPAYMAEFGEGSWELDALTPPVLNGIIENAIVNLLDSDRYDSQVKRQGEARKQLQQVATKWPKIVKSLTGKGTR